MSTYISPAFEIITDWTAECDLCKQPIVKGQTIQSLTEYGASNRVRYHHTECHPQPEEPPVAKLFDAEAYDEERRVRKRDADHLARILDRLYAVGENLSACASVTNPSAYKHPAKMSDLFPGPQEPSRLLMDLDELERITDRVAKAFQRAQARAEYRASLECVAQSRERLASLGVDLADSTPEEKAKAVKALVAEADFGLSPNPEVAKLQGRINELIREQNP